MSELQRPKHKTERDRGAKAHGVRDGEASRRTVDRPTEERLLALEDRYWRSLRDADLESTLALTADPCVVAGASGVARVGHDDFRRMMRDAHWRLLDYRMMDARVEVLGDDVAVVAYRVHEELVVDGAAVTLDASDASTWVLRDGAWRCALHTESVLGDPFGRDRAPHEA